MNSSTDYFRAGCGGFQKRIFDNHPGSETDGKVNYFSVLIDSEFLYFWCMLDFLMLNN